ncbi:MAG TPA: ThuA domain-containing protein, partial [Anaerolineales bacterium]|nr:ThuA domain-containing protein [Anaerolineales bacterium]
MIFIIENESEWVLEDIDNLIETYTMFSNIADRFCWIPLESHDTILPDFKIVLHSGHFSKIFQRLMGTTCNLIWREAAERERERIWVVEPGHPVAAGLGPYFEIPREEMYGERFDIPAPDTLVFLSWFQGGEVFRSGCCYHRGLGKIFYFRPGHETYPTYYQKEVLQVI